MNRYFLAPVALAVVLTGCASTDGKADSTPPTGSNADPSSSAPASTAPTPADDTTSTSAAPSPANPSFGQAFTWEDGLTVKVSRPRPFQPSEYASAGKGKAIRFTFTVVNKTKKAYDPSLFYATLQSGDVEAQEVFDVDHGLEGSPSTKVLPGRQSKFDLGYTVKNPRDLVLEVQPDAGIQYDSAIFTS